MGFTLLRDLRGRRGRQWENSSLAVILGLVVIVIYAGTVKNFFNTDDYTWLELARLVSEGQWSALFMRPAGHFRPLHVFILSLVYHWFGINPAAYHVLSIALHVVVSLLVFQLSNDLFMDRGYAFLSAGLFAVMVSHALAVSWIAALHDILTALFGLAAIILWIRYLRCGGVAYYISALVGYVLSLLSKELGVTLAVLLPACEFLMRTDPATKPGRELATRFWRYLPIAVILVGYAAIRITSGAGLNVRFGPHAIANLLNLLLFMFVPFTQNILRHFPVLLGSFLLAARLPLVLVFLLGTTYGFVRGSKSTRMSILLMVVPVLPVIWYYPPAELMRLPADIHSHYAYFPSVGASLLFAAGVRYLVGILRAGWITRAALWVAVGIYLLGNAVGVVVYNEVSVKPAGELERNIVGQLDRLVPSVQVNDNLYFDGDNPNWIWMRVRIGSLLPVFWGLRNRIYLVFAKESEKTEFARRWPLGMQNPPVVVVGSLQEIALTCGGDRNRVLFAEDHGNVRLMRCGQGL